MPKATDDSAAYETVDPVYIVPISDDDGYMMIDDVQRENSSKSKVVHDDTLQVDTNRV